VSSLVILLFYMIAQMAGAGGLVALLLGVHRRFAADASPLGAQLLAPGGWYGGGVWQRLDFVSLGVALVLGISSLPHVLVRFYTVPNASEARRSVAWCSWSMCVFYLAILVVGFGAAALVGADAIEAAPGGINSAAPLLAYTIGETILLCVVSAVAFATILAVVAGLTLAASVSFAHDVYATILRHGRPTRAWRSGSRAVRPR
jgi:cation/acetate symporter